MVCVWTFEYIFSNCATSSWSSLDSETDVIIEAYLVLNREKKILREYKKVNVEAIKWQQFFWTISENGKRF